MYYSKYFETYLLAVLGESDTSPPVGTPSIGLGTLVGGACGGWGRGWSIANGPPMGGDEDKSATGGVGLPT